MSLIRKLPGILDKAEEQYIKLLAESMPSSARTVMRTEGKDTGVFLLGDNAEILSEGIVTGKLSGKFDMIYCDPPFFTEDDKGARIPVKSEIVSDVREIRMRAYHDRWKNGFDDYLEQLALRLKLMKDALKDTGVICIHLDWHASHAVKLFMDEIFGENNFINEIIWVYKSGGAAKRHLSRKHDSILVYSKTGSYKFHQEKEKSYNRGMKPYRFKGVKEFHDEIGWYTLVNMKDVWQIDMVGRSSSERLNYATQKPEALLDRLIKLVTDEGDLCGDFYCGSGTLAASAGRLGRRFICADVSRLAAANAVKRPLRAGYGFNVREIGRLPGRGSCSVSAHRDGSFIVLDSFATDEAAVPARYVESMRELLEKDPFALLDYWCAGRLDSDGTFVSMEPVFRNGRDGLPVSKEDVLREFTAVMAVDIFGRMSVCALH